MNEIIHHQPTAGIVPYEEKLRMAQEHTKHWPQVFMPVKHYFGGGMYTRVLFVPAGTVIIGKQHLQAQHNFLLHGSIKLIGEHGDTVLHAPEVVVSPAGTKRAAITLTDVIWATTLKTDETTPEAVEASCIDPRDRDTSELEGDV